jgi:hypothetical protein
MLIINNVIRWALFTTFVNIIFMNTYTYNRSKDILFLLLSSI